MDATGDGRGGAFVVAGEACCGYFLLATDEAALAVLEEDKPMVEKIQFGQKGC